MVRRKNTFVKSYKKKSGTRVKAHDRKLWLVFNEYEGFTIMTPSEY